MIIFGSRMYAKKNRVVSYGKCESCGRYGKQQNYDGRKFGHLYFIPLIPEGGRVRVIGECGKCGRGAHIPVNSAEELQDATVEGVLTDLDRLKAGELKYTDKSGTHDVAAGLAGSIQMMYRLAGAGGAQTLVEEVRTAGDPRATPLVEAALHQAQGKVEEALQHLRQAEQAMPESPVPSYLQGSLLADVGRTREAAESLARASALAPDDVGLKLELIDVYMADGQFGRAVDLFETVFARLPECAQDGKFLKLYRKACKKARRPATAA